MRNPKRNRSRTLKLRVLRGVSFAFVLVSSFVVIEKFRPQESIDSKESELADSHDSHAHPTPTSSVGSTTTRMNFHS